MIIEVYALDQGGNRQEVIWKSPRMEEGYLYTNAGGSNYSYTIELDNPESIDTEAMCTEPYDEDSDQLNMLTPQKENFQIIHPDTGTVV